MDQVRDLVGAVKYRPLKGEKLYAALTGQTPLEPELQSYLAQRNANNIAVVNVESIPALEALDEIVAVDGLDAVLIGPHDLSCSLGVPEQYTHPTFVEAVDTIIQTARARGIGAGIHAAYASPIEQEIRWAKMGANLIVHAMDITAYRSAMRHDIDTIKAALAEGASERAMESINI